MNRPILIIEMPELSNESVGKIHHFLNALVLAFEEHYRVQIREYYRDPCLGDLMGDSLWEDSLDDLF
jgi:hypothetical protein